MARIKYLLHLSMGIGLLLVAVTLPQPVQAQPNAAPQLRQRTDISDGWQLAPVSGLEAIRGLNALANLPKDGWRAVAIPNLGDGRGYFKIYAHPEEQGGWYRRTLALREVPAGQRVLLQFRAASYITRVWVNGHFVGSHDFHAAPFELDITAAVKPGDNELIVSCAPNIDLAVDPKAAWHLREIGTRGYQTPLGIWDRVYLHVAPPIRTSDIFVRPSYRTKSLSATVTLTNSAPLGWKGRVVGRVVDAAGQVCKTLPAVEAGVAALSTAPVELLTDWPDFRMWTPQDPYLYHLEVELTDEAGQVVDRTRQRFGFREVWIDKSKPGQPEIMMNGQPLRFYGYGLWPNWGHGKDHWVEQIRRGPWRYMTGCRTHAMEAPESFFEACDETGFLVVCETGLLQEAPFWREATWRTVFHQYAKWVIAKRNHPSIVIWSMDNEACHAGLPAPHVASMPWLTKLCDQYHALDPTRPVTASNDYDAIPNLDVHAVGGGPHINTYSALPNEYRLVLQMFDGLRGRKQGKPAILTEWGENPNCFDAHASIAGEKLFEGPLWFFNRGEDGSGSWCLNTQRLRIAALHSFWGIKEMRRVGMPIICSFAGVGDHPLVNTPQDNEINQRLSFNACGFQVAFNQRYGRNFVAGRANRFGVLVINDAFVPLQQGEVRITFRRPGQEQPYLTATRPVKLDRGQRGEVVVEWTFPAVETRIDLEATTELLDAGRVVYREEWTAAVYPPVSGFDRVEPVRLYDPKDTTAPLFRRLGVRFTPLARWQDALADTSQPLVLGAEAADGLTTADQDRLSEWVRAGGRLLVLPQTRPLLSLGGVWFTRGLKYATAWDAVRPYSATIAHPTSPDHPVLRGTGPEDFRFWRADDLLAPVCLIKPDAGNFRPLLSAGRTVDRFFSVVDVGLAGTPLAEVFSGAGLVVLCQALVTEAENDPCAATVLRNLLAYLHQPQVPGWRPVVGPIPPPLRLPGLVNQPKNAPGAAVRLVLAAGNADFAQALAESLPAVREGQTLYLHHLDPATAKLLSEATGHRFSVADKYAYRRYNGWESDPNKRAANPFVAEPAPIYTARWQVRTGLALGQSSNDLWFGYSDHMPHAVTTDAPGAIHYSEPCVLLEVPMGKGRLVINQVRWDQAESAKPYAQKRLRRYAAVLLTNLGVAVDLYRPGSQAPAVAADAYIHLSFDEKDPRRLRDSSGCGSDMVVNGPVEFVPGKFGAALRFTEPSGFAEFEARQDLYGRIPPRFSIDCWLRPSQREPGQVFTNNRSFRGELDAKGHFQFGSIYHSGQSVRSQAPLPLHEWTRVTLTIDTEKGVMKLYLNGKLDAQSAAIGHYPHGYWSLGASQQTSEKRAAFRGAIDEFRVFDDVIEVAP
jgi:hypothetical protein